MTTPEVDPVQGDLVFQTLRENIVYSIHLPSDTVASAGLSGLWLKAFPLKEASPVSNFFYSVYLEHMFPGAKCEEETLWQRVCDSAVIVSPVDANKSITLVVSEKGVDKRNNRGNSSHSSELHGDDGTTSILRTSQRNVAHAKIRAGIYKNCWWNLDFSSRRRRDGAWELLERRRERCLEGRS